MAIKQKTNFYIYIFFLALFSTNFYLGYILDGNNFFLIFPGYTFFHLMQLILLLIPILINWNRLIKYYKQFKLNLYYRFFLFYLFVSFLSIFRSVNPTQSFYKYLILVMALFNIVLIVSSIFSVTNKQDFDKVIYNIWFSVAKISTLFFLILLMGYIFNPYSYSYPVFKGTIDRLYGSSFFLVAPNITSQIAAVNLLFYINFRSKCENKLIMDFIFIVSFFALILSQSRITLFALIILLLIRGFYLFFGKTKIFLKIVILFFSILIISFGLLYKSDFISYSLRGQDQNAIITGTGRTTYWFLAYNYLSNHNKTFYFGDGYYTGARFFNDKFTRSQKGRNSVGSTNATACGLFLSS